MSKQNTRTTRRPMRTWVKIVIGIVVVALLAVTVGPFVYINYIKDDAPTSAEERGLPTRGSTADSAADAGTTDGTIDGSSAGSSRSTDPTVAAPPTAAPTTTPAPATATVADVTTSVAVAASGETFTFTPTNDTFVGYRVVEVLFGQDTEGVGRTNDLTGSLTLDGTQITAAAFTVDMATLKSDEDNRDRKFRGEIMDTAQFPTATFVITEPIEVGSIPPEATEVTASATGDLTLHGVTRPVTLEVRAQRAGDIIDVLGSIDIVFADYAIDNPSNGGITTQDHGLLEFVLTFAKT